mgnify:FL=1
MKKGLFYALCLGALAMSASCQKTQQNSTEKGNSVVFTAKFDNEKNVDVRTVLDETGKKSLWNKDEIRVLNEEGASAVYKTDAMGQASATFTILEEGATFSGNRFMAACPAEPAGRASWDAGGKTIKWLWLKDEQSPVAGSYDPAAHIAVAYTEGTELSFKNACALLKFTVASENVSEVVVYTTGGGENTLYLSGNFDVDMSEQNNYKFSRTSGDGSWGGNYVKIKAADGAYLENGKTYYMACIPVTAILNLEVVVNGVRQTIRTTSDAVEIKRNDVLDLGDVAPVEKTLYLKPQADFWDQANARFEAYTFAGAENMWYDFTPVKDGIYSVSFPMKWTGLVLVRRGPEQPSHTWDDGSSWNKTSDIILSSLGDDNLITITGWGESDYTTSVYTE